MDLAPLACHADVTAGSDVVTVTDAVLTDSNCRANAQVAVAGASYFVAARLTTTTFRLERDYEGDDASGVTCSIGVFTPEMASRVALSQQLRDYDARAVLIADNQAGLSYIYSAAVAGVPADGQLTLDNADPSLAALVRLNNADASGQTISDRIDRWRIGDEITLRATDGSARVTYLVSSAPVDETGYRQAGVTYSGAFGTFAAGADIVIERIAKGDTGPAGAPGAAGADGTDGADGVLSSGSAGTTDNALLRADGTGGNAVQGSPLIVDDSGNTSGMGTLAAGAITTSGLLTTTNGQIGFPATQNAASGANVLDDYEEGTTTPSYTFGGASTGITYSQQNGVYVKIGQAVIVNNRLVLSSVGTATGTANIVGLPFTNSGYTVPVLFGYYYAMTMPTANWPAGYVNASATTILMLYAATTSGISALSNSAFTSTSNIMFGINFRAAA